MTINKDRIHVANIINNQNGFLIKLFSNSREHLNDLEIEADFIEDRVALEDIIEASPDHPRFHDRLHSIQNSLDERYTLKRLVHAPRVPEGAIS